MSRAPKGALDTYSTLIKNIKNPMKAVRGTVGTSHIARELVATSISGEELIHSVRKTGSAVNSAALLDSLSTIEVLSSAALVIPGKAANELKTIKKESQKVANEIKKVVTQEDANDRILDYYQAVTDSNIISQGLIEIANTIGDEENSGDLLDKIKGWMQGIISKINE